ncbi:MAG: sugar ABC transporter permease [Treponema sp.]|nr:sugar ABC transporter permease [Treponema sp.]
MATKKIVSDRINKKGYYFIIPFVLVYLLFNFWPTIYTFILSVGDLKGLKKSFKIIGFGNFVRLVTDKYFWGSVANTFIIWGLNFAPQLGIALLLAVWFTDVKLRLKGTGLFRAVFYMPNLLTAASVALLFKSLFGYPVGPANQMLLGFGLVEKAYQFDRNGWALRFIIAFIQWWMWCGQTLILLMAGITSISPSLYESATIDGANDWQCTWKITVPLLRPIMFFLLITSMVGGMQMFDIPFLLTDMRGGVNFMCRTMAVYLYNIGFQGTNQYSYAAAIAIGMFIITVVLSRVINWLTSDHSRVKHAVEEAK